MVKRTLIPGKDKIKPGIQAEEGKLMLELYEAGMEEKRRLDAEKRKVNEALGIPGLAKKFDYTQRQVRRELEKQRRKK